MMRSDMTFIVLIPVKPGIPLHVNTLYGRLRTGQMTDKLNSYDAAGSGVGTELATLGVAIRCLPLLDPRAADEILGYDENGLPT